MPRPDGRLAAEILHRFAPYVAEPTRAASPQTLKTPDGPFASQVWRLVANFIFLGGFGIPFAVKLMMMCAPTHPAWGQPSKQHDWLIVLHLLGGTSTRPMPRRGSVLATAAPLHATMACPQLSPPLGPAERRARYGVFLEKTHFEGRTADFAWMLVFGMSVLVVRDPPSRPFACPPRSPVLWVETRTQTLTSVLESSRASPHPRSREDGHAHHADTSRSNLAPALGLLSRCFRTFCGSGFQRRR